MIPEDSNNTEDIGRRHSENQLRNKMNSSKYLDDVIEQTGLDYDEALDMIERERTAIDVADTGFLTSLDVVQPTANDVDRINSKKMYASTPRNRAKSNYLELLLASAEASYKTYIYADQAITDGTNTSKDSVYSDEARENDRKRIRDVVAAGKRMLESEVDVKGKGKQAQRALDGSSDENVAEELFKGVFGFEDGGIGEDGSKDVARTLKYMTKGVKKMGKGLRKE